MAKIEMRLLSSQREVLFVITGRSGKESDAEGTSEQRDAGEEIKESKVYLPSTSIFVPSD